MNRANHLFLVLFVTTAMPASAWAQSGIQYDKIEIKNRPGRAERFDRG
jgi:hypothetical protein